MQSPEFLSVKGTLCPKRQSVTKSIFHDKITKGLPYHIRNSKLKEKLHFNIT